MAAYWIVKTDTDTYSFDDLRREGRTVWDGVSNAVALKHLRSMSPGDRVLVYHSGEEKAVVGLARVVSEPYQDPKRGDPKLTVVDLQADRPLERPVTLAAIKADPSFKDLPLVRVSRLSVGPVPAPQWKRLLAMGGIRDAD
jgi:predicted RNA-binding protein with PUA-like domain